MFSTTLRLLKAIWCKELLSMSTKASWFSSSRSLDTNIWPSLLASFFRPSNKFHTRFVTHSFKGKMKSTLILTLVGACAAVPSPAAWKLSKRQMLSDFSDGIP